MMTETELDRILAYATFAGSIQGVMLNKRNHWQTEEECFTRVAELLDELKIKLGDTE